MKETAPQHRITRLPRDGMTELFITSSAAEGAALPAIRAWLGEYARSNKDVRILREDVFGPFDAEGGETHASVADGAAWPVMRIGEAGRSSDACAACCAYAVEGASVETICADGRAVGTVFEDRYARHCILGDLRVRDTSLPRESQARRVFEMMEETLGLAGMDISNAVRTWLFIDDILGWYAEFNAVRTKFFTERGLFDQVVPASTGVGGSSPAGAAVVAGLLAVAPKGRSVRVEAVPSPLQCSPLDYNSSFNRAETRSPIPPSFLWPYWSRSPPLKIMSS